MCLFLQELRKEMCKVLSEKVTQINLNLRIININSLIEYVSYLRKFSVFIWKTEIELYTHSLYNNYLLVKNFLFFEFHVYHQSLDCLNFTVMRYVFYQDLVYLGFFFVYLSINWHVRSRKMKTNKKLHLGNPCSYVVSKWLKLK